MAIATETDLLSQGTTSSNISHKSVSENGTIHLCTRQRKIPDLETRNKTLDRGAIIMKERHLSTH